MTIRKGEDWGTRTSLRPGDPIVSADSDLASFFSVVNGEISGPERVGLVGGDLARTVGGMAQPDELRQGERPALPIDLGIVTIDGTTMVMASNLVIRRPRWAGAVDAAMNAGFLGSWNVAPSSHPNDGRFDVVHAELSLGDRCKARSRLDSGTHIPHPDIGIRRLKSAVFAPDRRARVWVDGVCLGSASEVTFVVCADATHVLI